MAKKKDVSIRIGVTLRGDLAEAFLKEVDKREPRPTDAALARLFLQEALQQRGHKVGDEVTWGGRRSKPQDEPGQGVAVAAT